VRISATHAQTTREGLPTSVSSVSRRPPHLSTSLDHRSTRKNPPHLIQASKSEHHLLHPSVHVNTCSQMDILKPGLLLPVKLRDAECQLPGRISLHRWSTPSCSPTTTKAQDLETTSQQHVGPYGGAEWKSDAQNIAGRVMGQWELLRMGLEVIRSPYCCGKCMLQCVSWAGRDWRTTRVEKGVYCNIHVKYMMECIFETRTTCGGFFRVDRWPNDVDRCGGRRETEDGRPSRVVCACVAEILTSYANDCKAATKPSAKRDPSSRCQTNSNKQ
jgi:hypothetical protein